MIDGPQRVPIEKLVMIIGQKEIELITLRELLAEKTKELADKK